MSSPESYDPQERLGALLIQGKAPHALLFAGPGQGAAAQAARHFAASLFCRSAKGGLKSCGICAPCALVAAGTHPDLRWLVPEETGVIKIDAVREVIREAALKPFQELRRVVVIERAESMNEHAQNALLKTLEEPPGPAHFILLSESPEQLLPTVRSRVQKLFFAQAGRPAAADETEEAARKEALDYLLGETDKAPDWQSWDRPDVLRVLEAVLGDLRDVMVIAAGAQELSRADHRPFKERAARRLRAEDASELLEKVSAFKESIRLNTNLKLALAVLWAETGSRARQLAG